MRQFTVTTIAIVLICASRGTKAKNYAIVVAVNACPEFRLPNGSKPRPLRGAEHDANAIAGLLTKQFDFPAKNVLVLKSEQASHEGISKAFESVANKLKASDQFVFHFSGHGTQINDKRPYDEGDRLDEALCTWDSRSDGTNLIRDDELGLWLEELAANRITVILDCCHAGTGIKDADDEFVPRYLPMQVEAGKSDASEHWQELQGSSKHFGRRLTAFFACQAGQQAYERRILQYKPLRRMGQFTYHFTTGLKDAKADADNDGKVSQQEILAYVSGILDTTFNKERSEPSEHQLPYTQTDFPDDPVFHQ